MSAEKRPASNSFGSSQMVKRQKSDTNLGGKDAVVVVNGNTQNGALIQALWKTYSDCENYGMLSGHKGAVLDLQWSRDSRVLFSASADMTLASWDLETGTRIKRHEGHEEVINCMSVSKRGEELLISGSDDGCIGVGLVLHVSWIAVLTSDGKIWDPRQKQALEYIETEFPVTAVAISEAGNELYSGSIDNDIKVWDIRKKAVAYSMIGHTDTVTSLEVSPDSQLLLSNSHDSTVRTWDIRPFAPLDRHVKTFDGAPIGLEKNLIRASWDSKGQRIAAGSGDRTAVVWDVGNGRLLYKLPGHKGTVNDVRFAPGDEPIRKFPAGHSKFHALTRFSASCLRVFRSHHHARRAR
ncbi:MAG: hypothetical protein Q9157_003908 [Trypethelium eluteriae]